MKALTGLVHSLSTRLRDETIDAARKTTAAVVAGLLVSGTIIFVFSNENTADPDNAVLPRDIANVTKISLDVAEQHREERYADISSITDVLALPSQFSQAEALHSLAGRSDSAAIQGLIFEAARIADHITREQTLAVLFSRLTEIDAPSALALARTDEFRYDKRVEQSVWQALGRLDLEEAISLALMQATHARQNLAAQALFSAYGYMGNDATDRIEAELGIKPDNATRAKYVEILAARSVADAIEFINSRHSSFERRTLINTVAHAVVRQDPERALTYADLIRDSQLKRAYRSTVLIAQAAQNPTQVLDRLVAAGGAGLDTGQVYAAFRAVVDTDIDQALEYYEKLEPGELRDGLAAHLARRLAQEDLDEAIAWARDQQYVAYPSALMAVIREAARSDPSRVLETILADPDERSRRFMLQSFMQTVARGDPQMALSYLDQLPDGQSRRMIAQSAVNALIRTDPDAAVSWVLAQDDAMARRLLAESMMLLVSSDVRAAMRVIPTLPAEQARHYMVDVARRLAESGAQVEAMSLISRYEGQEGYAELQAAVVSGMAARDPIAAKQLADQLPDVRARDRAYANIIQHHASTDPAEALRWIKSISSEGLRNQATQMLIQNWGSRDTAAATRYVQALAPGKTRDMAILGMVGNWPDIGPDQEALINSIEDPQLRSQANMNRVFTMMPTDPAGARQLLDNLDLTEEQRRQAESMLEQMRMYR